MNSNAPKTLMESYSVLEDPRDPSTCRHKLIDIVAIAIAAVICGADDLTSIKAFGKAKFEWFDRFLGPSMYRVLPMCTSASRRPTR